MTSAKRWTGRFRHSESHELQPTSAAEAGSRQIWTPTQEVAWEERFDLAVEAEELATSPEVKTT